MPFAVWVHLADPLHAGGDAGSGDAAVAAVVDAVDAAGVLHRTTFIVVGAHGLLRGEHGSDGNVGLWEPVVR